MTTKYIRAVYFRVTAEQRDRLDAHLAYSGLSLGNFFRRKISELRPPSYLMQLSGKEPK